MDTTVRIGDFMNVERMTKPYGGAQKRLICTIIIETQGHFFECMSKVMYFYATILKYYVTFLNYQCYFFRNIFGSNQNLRVHKQNVFHLVSNIYVIAPVNMWV